MSREIRPLTGLRAVAAYAVLVAHLVSWFVATRNPGLQPDCERLAYFGISLFFVLSGFVMEANYLGRIAGGGGREVYDFFVARFARLYPLYAAAIAAAIMLGMSAHLRQMGIWLPHLTLTQSWFGSIRGYDEATWTISTEWFFYFVFVLLARPLCAVKHPGRALVVVLAAGWLGVGAMELWLPHVQAFIGNDMPWLLDRGDLSINSRDWLEYYSPLTRLPEFITGVMCGRLYHGGSFVISRWAAGAAALWCIAVLMAGGRIEVLHGFLSNIVYAPGLAVLVLYVTQRNIVASVLSSWPVWFGGVISYSVYLTQGFIVGNAESHAHGSLSALFALSFLYVTLTSMATWAAIEWPSRWLLRRLLTAR
jgi:peptidoglycan/LPS O-acetylase OafA/YrhL